MRRVAVVLSALAAVLLPGAVSPAGAVDTLPVPYQFLPSAILGGMPDADAPGTNDWDCKPTAAHPRPVVLVHGTAGNRSTNWQTYGPLLKNNGYCVFALTYGVPAGSSYPASALGGMNDIASTAQELGAFIDKVLAATGSGKVDIPGHSQGTLMPDYYAKFLGGAHRIHAYVSLAPLWHGTGLGDVGPVLALAFGEAADQPTPYCVACGQMSTGSDFMATMRTGGVAVPGIRYTNIVTRYDELVSPYTSGIEPGMRNITLQDSCATDYTEHFEIAADPVAAGFVLNALDPAHPRPVPCTVVLPFEGPVA
jgi:triacylglycerol lipase